MCFMNMQGSRSYQGKLKSKKKIGDNHAFFLEIIKEQLFQKTVKYKAMYDIFFQIEAF